MWYGILWYRHRRRPKSALSLSVRAVLYRFEGGRDVDEAREGRAIEEVVNTWGWGEGTGEVYVAIVWLIVVVLYISNLEVKQSLVCC